MSYDDSTLEQAAEEPRKVATDAVTVEAHSLKDMIEFDKYQKAKAAADHPHRGLRFMVFRPPGAP